MSASSAGYLHFHRPSIGPTDETAVLEVLRSGWLTTGPKAKEFERRFAEFRGTSRAVATNSCTAALHVALVAMGVGPGDEVITTPITFASTANVIVHTGATPVFCDVQTDTLNMDPASFEAAITDRTKVVIPVHFAGHPCDMDEIVSIAEGHGIRVLEDAAHAAEAQYRDRPTGSLGDAGAFSFYATKNITTGEGGMLTTSDDSLADEAQVLSLHGISRDAWKRYTSEGYKHWDIVAPGFKYNMPDITAALGLSQLERIEDFWESRRYLTQRYDRALGGVPGLRVMARRDYVRSSYHLYVVRLTEQAGISRDGMMTSLQEVGIGVGVHFRPVHLHPFYVETYGFGEGLAPIAERAGASCLSLPLFPSMTDQDVDRVADACRAILAG